MKLKKKKRMRKFGEVSMGESPFCIEPRRYKHGILALKLTNRKTKIEVKKSIQELIVDVEQVNASLKNFSANFQRFLKHLALPKNRPRLDP